MNVRFKPLEPGRYLHMCQARWRRIGLTLLMPALLLFALSISMSLALAWDEESLPFYDPLDPNHPVSYHRDDTVSSVHFDLVGALVIAAGFSEQDAAIIQIYSQLTDKGALPLQSQTYAYDADPANYLVPPPISEVKASQFCPSPETTAPTVTMGMTGLIECPGCFTSRWGPYNIFFHMPHFDREDELIAIRRWAFAETDALTGVATFGYSSTVPFTWAPVYTIANVANIYESTACFITRTVPAMDTGSVKAGSLEALGTYLHSLGDAWSHKACIEAADQEGKPFGAHVTVKGPKDPLWPCRWPAHDVEFGDPQHFPDSNRTYSGTVDVYNALIAFAAQSSRPIFRSIPLTAENGHIDSVLQQFVHTDSDDPQARRTIAEELRLWSLVTRATDPDYWLSTPQTYAAGDLTVTVHVPPGAAGSSVNLTVSVGEEHAPGAGKRIVGNSFNISATDGSGDPITGFAKSLTVLVGYTDADARGVKEESLQLHYWDAGAGKWQPLLSDVDVAANLAVGSVDRLSEFAVLADAGDFIAESRFTTDREGWRVDGDVQKGSGIPDHRLVGGRPGGHLQATDDVQGGTWYWVAPDKFLGDVSAAYSKVLSFDLKQESNMSGQYNRPDVVLKGRTNMIIYDTAFNPRQFWTSYAVWLHESAGWRALGVSEPLTSTNSWGATQADILAVLGDLQQLIVRGEYEDGADVGSLDNVVLGSEPVTPTIEPGEGLAALLELGLPVLVEFPAGSVTETITLTGGLTGGHPAPEGRRLLGNSFFVEAHNAAGEQITQFVQPFTMTVSAQRVDHQDFSFASLAVYYWDGNASQWRSLPSVADASAEAIIATLDHLTEFAVFGEPARSAVYLPMVTRP